MDRCVMFGFPQIAFTKGWKIVSLPCSQYQDPESILAFTRKIKSSLRSHQLGEWEVILEVIHQGKKFAWKCIWIDWLSEKRQQIYFTRSVCYSIIQTSLSTQVNMKILHLILKMLYAYEWTLGFCIRFLNCYVLIK